MSRVGKKPILIPSGVQVDLKGRTVHLEGPQGKLQQELHPEVQMVLEESGRVLHIASSSESMNKKAARRFSQFQGLFRALVANMVEGVSQGFRKELDIQGVGYNAKLQGRELVLNIGYCHPIMKKIPEGLDVELTNPTHIVVKGCDKQKVGQLAAEIRSVRAPEPYKGKGIRYREETVRTKSGKKFVGGE